MSFFVSRADGQIAGVYAYRCEGFAEEELQDEDAELEAYLNPPPPADYIIPKALPWRRMTEEEAGKVTAAMSQATARQRAIYDAAQEIDTSDELYGILAALLGGSLTPDRAAALLARQ